MSRVLLALGLVVAWWCFVVWAVGAVLAAWGVVPAILVAVVLLARRPRP